MVDRFENAVEEVLVQEGGYANSRSDPGGATNFGISLRFVRAEGILEPLDQDGDGKITPKEIREMSRSEAISIYKKYWWDRYKVSPTKSQSLFDALPPGIGEKMFSLSVNMGVRTAAKALQRAVRACGVPIKDDGDVGPITLASLPPIPPRMLLPAFRSEAACIYRQIAALKPDLAGFLTGWLRRAYEV